MRHLPALVAALLASCDSPGRSDGTATADTITPNAFDSSIDGEVIDGVISDVLDDLGYAKCVEVATTVCERLDCGLATWGIELAVGGLHGSGDGTPDECVSAIVNGDIAVSLGGDPVPFNCRTARSLNYANCLQFISELPCTWGVTIQGADDAMTALWFCAQGW